MLPRLSVLKRRFHRFWHQRRYLAYQSQFTTETYMYDALLKTNAQEYAKETTYSDIPRFLWFNPQSPNTTADCVHIFNSFSNGVAECGAADPALRSFWDELAKVKKPYKFLKDSK